MHSFPDLRDSHERTAIMSASDFDPGNMTTSSTPPQGSKKKSWDDGDDSSVTCVDFAKRPKFQKSTHPDSFFADKNKFLSTVKPLELENFKTGSKIGLWGFLLNMKIKYDGPLLDELSNLCRMSK